MMQKIQYFGLINDLNVIGTKTF